MLKNLQIGLASIFLLILSYSTAYATKCKYLGPTTITPIAWADSNNWSCGNVPMTNDKAILPPNQSYTLTGNIFTPAIVFPKGQTTLLAGASLNCTKLTVDASFTNHGTISFNGPTVNYRLLVRKNDSFTNSSTGVINIVSTSLNTGNSYMGGIRLALNSNFNNLGSVSINVPAGEPGIILDSGATYTDMNGGTLEIISGDTDCTLGTCSFSLLPVVLAEIQAYEKGTANLIEWATVSEENSHYFAVEYMEQGANTWRELKRISAAGDSDYLIEYNFQHENPAKKAYYRLKMVDLDGSFEYSTVLSVHNQNTATSKFPVRLYPTVSAGTVYLERQNQEVGIVRIFNATGHMLKAIDLSNNRESVIKLSVSNLQTGMYFLRVDNQATQRFIIGK